MADSGTVLGIDGCRRGWAVAVVRADGTVQLRVTATFGEAVGASGQDPVLVGVDMPIGLPSGGPRPCDAAARALLGPRRATVFPAPARAVLEARDYADALRLSQVAIGRGLSRETWMLVPKVAEVDHWMRAEQDPPVVEVHPELAFATMAGHPLAAKRDPAGRRHRLALLAEDLAGFDDALEQFLAAGRRASLVGDMVDAAAVAWSARRLARGGGVRLGGELDEAGVPMAISY